MHLASEPITGDIGRALTHCVQHRCWPSASLAVSNQGHSCPDQQRDEEGDPDPFEQLPYPFGSRRLWPHGSRSDHGRNPVKRKRLQHRLSPLKSSDPVTLGVDAGIDDPTGGSVGLAHRIASV